MHSRWKGVEIPIYLCNDAECMKSPYPYCGKFMFFKKYWVPNFTGAVSRQKCRLINIWIPVIKIRRSLDSLILMKGIHMCLPLSIYWNRAWSTVCHHDDVIMGAMVSQITSLTIVYSDRLFRRRSKKTSKLRITGLCAGNSPGTDEFPAQMASNAENVSIWWRHHVTLVHSGQRTLRD